MSNLKTRFIEFLSHGISPQIEGKKRLSLQLAFFDAWSSIITAFFYTLYSLYFQLEPMTYYHIIAFSFMALSIHLLRTGRYDSGRALMQYCGTFEIFMGVDAVGFNHGYEFYYFINIVVPFLVFTVEEHKKATLLSAGTGAIILLQQFLGTNLFSQGVSVPRLDNTLAFGIVIFFTILIFAVARWLMNLTQEEIDKKQSELIHHSNIMALGEMAGSVAHEIRNPLSIFSSGLEHIKKNGADSQRLEVMERHVEIMSKIVRGLTNLSRNAWDDAMVVFPISESIEDVLIVCEQRIKDFGIDLSVKGDQSVKIKGHVVHLSQVLINLLNNSIDALKTGQEKWIHLEVKSDAYIVQISVTDAGKGISSELARSIMRPFFTTKNPGQGTGLGLSISQSIIEKKGGSLYLDSKARNTRFVIELPVHA